MARFATATAGSKPRKRLFPLLDAATRPSNSGWGRLKSRGAPEGVHTLPSAASTSATPAATSHSFLGTRVQVASAWPAATSASLYATEPTGRILNGASPERFHSPRPTSLRLASTTAPFRAARFAFRFPCAVRLVSSDPRKSSLVAGL